MAGRSTGGARRWVRAQLASWPPTALDRLESIVGELVANALEHGAPPVTLLLEPAAPAQPVRLTVWDRGEGPAPAAYPPHVPPTDARERGRGLELVEALGATLRTRSDERGHRAQIELSPGTAD